MKNKILYLLSFVVVVAATGCKKKFLEDMKSYDKYDESIFTNEVQTGWYIDRLYNYYFASYRNPTQTIVGLYDDVRSRSTEEIGGTINTIINPNRTLQAATDADTYFGGALPSGVTNNPYTRIRNANFLLEKIDGIGQALPESFRKTSRGQMYFFRALQYFELVRIYGGVPIVTTVQNASAIDETIKAPRATTSEVVDQIIKDLDSAAALLPMKWATAATDYGRFTAAAALAMKSRVLLTAASPLFNTDWDNSGNAKWQKALTASLAAETALTANGYGNSINSAKDWSEVTFKNDNAFNAEAIMVQLLSNNTAASGFITSTWENTVRPRDHGGTGNGISVPKAMLDLFPLANGTRPTSANGYVDTFFFENRDPRFYRTFAFSGSKWGLKNNANKATWLYRWRPSATGAAVYYGNNQTSSPAVVRKMSNPNADSAIGLGFSGTDNFEYRYGELLLNIAECYAATGNVAKCVEYLGKIRARVGIPSANNYGIGTLADRYAAIEACLYERRIELAYEGKRFWDLQRWILFDDDAASSDNTNSKLGIPVINGTNRTGYYWQAKTFTSSDPLTAADRNISIDPDAPATFNAEIAKLRALYTNKFVMTTLDQAMDRDGTTPVNILFRPNYYISGLHNTVLLNNPWLPQTKGWLTPDGSTGTFDYKQ